MEEAKRAVKELDRTVFAPTLGGRFARVVRVRPALGRQNTRMPRLMLKLLMSAGLIS